MTRVLLPIAVTMGLFVGFMFVMDRFMFDEMFDEQKFWQQADAIQITSHHPGRDEEGGRCVIGTMRNVSETPWHFIRIQVDYYNAENELVDTSQDYLGGALAPGQERSFKVVFESDQRDVEYDHYQVFIAGADDASRF